MTHQNLQREPAADATAGKELRPLAEAILDYCDTASDIAADALSSHRGPQTSALANLNSFTDKAPQSLAAISDQERRNLEAVLERPAVARLVTLNDRGEEEVIYITPSGAPKAAIGTARIASYRSDVGRLAAQPVGEEILLANGRRVELLAKTTFSPERSADRWDAYNAIVESDDRPPRTIVSLRALINALPAEDALELLNAALRGGQALVYEGIRRSVLERMTLRDQPLLDQYQDDIFRRSLDTQLLILGPPGSGKTTTLIKRLGMKVDPGALTEDEQRVVETSVAGANRHASSWMMFSPSELLRQYVKEAFAREQIPASDFQMQVWDRYRERIAKDTLGILRTGARSGANIRPTLRNLQPQTVIEQIRWYEDFMAWQEARFWSDLAEVAVSLEQDGDHGQPGPVRQVIALIMRNADAPSPASFGAFRRFEKEVREIASAQLEAVNSDLRRAFAEQMQAGRIELEQLLAFVQTLDEDQDDPDEGEFELDEDDDEVRDGRVSREAAFDVYIRAVRAHARAVAGGRRLSARSRNGRIVEWMGERLPSKNALVELGRRARQAQALRRLSNPMNAYLRQLPVRYRRFRSERAANGEWYADTPYARTDLSPLELDLIILAILRVTRGLIALNREVGASDSGLMERVTSLFRTQILVDEATDFSAIQLACMAAMADPSAESFTACGDFNQRITEWGVRTSTELTWVSQTLQIERIEITYRHSRQLNALAHRIAELGDEAHEAAALPVHVDNEGVDPVMGTGLDDLASLAQWITDRIAEIEQITGVLPSLAVLVNTESEVEPLAEALGALLAERNTRCTPCLRGQATGDDGDVRVFDIQHIKGLEFEGVFFVGVDRMAADRPELFNKFLYVGATRAAMYLGMTMEGDVPAVIEPIADAFVSSWSDRT